MNQNRNTRQRQYVLTALKSRHDHPSAEQIYLDVKAIDHRISRSTVYRNLSILVQQGEAHQIKISQADHFETRPDTHHHFVCVACKSIMDLPLVYQSELDEQIAKKTLYVIHKHHIVFEGLCTACQQKSISLNK